MFTQKQSAIKTDPPELTSIHSRMSNEAMPKVTVRSVGNQFSKWGEGPVWWKHALFYVDIEGHRLIRFDPEKNKEQIWEIGERIGTVVPTEEPVGPGKFAKRPRILIFSDPDESGSSCNRFVGRLF